MSPWWKRIAIALLAAFVVAQFIPVRKTNPQFDPGGSLWAASPAPPEISAIFQRSCQDCHSNHTRWPWYSHVAPVSWFIADDVNSGRRHLNVDDWNTYSLEKRQSKLTKICEELKSGDMPDSNYTFIHRGAKLTDQDKAALCGWAETSRQALLHAEIAVHP
jgi:hypothetical protein